MGSSAHSLSQNIGLFKIILATRESTREPRGI